MNISSAQGARLLTAFAFVVLFLASLHIGWRVKAVFCLHPRGCRMQVNHGGLDKRMPELLADREKPGAAIEHVRGERMPEQVRMNALREPGSLRCHLHQFAEILGRDLVPVAPGDKQSAGIPLRSRK